MGKNVDDLKKEYTKVNFRIVEPILDIGGGDGSFLKSQGIKKATILEGTPERKYPYNYINVNLTKKLPNLNKKFKTIFIMEVLEHLSNPLYLLAQVYDILDEKGKCYISVPYTSIGEDLQHVCRWKLKEVEGQLRKLGFEVKVLEKRRRFKNLAFFLPHCWLVLELTKSKRSLSKENIEDYELNFKDK